jgi:hypothetical protein
MQVSTCLVDAYCFGEEFFRRVEGFKMEQRAAMKLV